MDAWSISMDSKAHSHCVHLIFSVAGASLYLSLYLVCMGSRKGHEQRWDIVVYM